MQQPPHPLRVVRRTLFLSLLLLPITSAFITTQRTPASCSSRQHRRGMVRVVLSASAVEEPAASTGVSTEELVKVFGRLAEKQIFLDSSAGACCHSGCDGCPYRYDFDIMRAVRPKWVPTYAERVFDSDSHRAKWRSIFDNVPEAASPPVSDEDLFNETTAPASSLTYEVFAERVKALEFLPPLGAPVEVSSGEELDAGTTKLLWQKMTGGSGDGGRLLSADGMQKRLLEWAEGGDSLMWSGFQAALLAN